MALAVSAEAWLNDEAEETARTLALACSVPVPEDDDLESDVREAEKRGQRSTPPEADARASSESGVLEREQSADNKLALTEICARLRAL